MKKLIYLFLLLTSVLPVFAERWTVAPKIGLNVSDMTGSYDGRLKLGLNAGFGVECRFSTIFALETGAFYSMEGTHDYGDTRKYDYINVPVLLKAFAGKSGFNVFVGPQLGVNVMEKIVTTTGDGYQVTQKTDDILPVNFSLVFGLGYQFESGFLVSANYNAGVVNVDEYSYNESIRHRVFQFNIGWRF